MLNWRVEFSVINLRSVARRWFEVFTFERKLSRMIRLLVQYFFNVGLKLVNLSSYGNLVAEEKMRSSG